MDSRQVATQFNCFVKYSVLKHLRKTGTEKDLMQLGMSFQPEGEASENDC